MIENVHARQVPDAPTLLDRMMELWPADHWPPLRLDRPLGVGADGGHGFVRYTCTAYEPGARVEFTFAPGLGLVGTHTLYVVPGGLRHVLRGKATGSMRLWWPLAIRWLHDALMEDLFDNAEKAAGRTPARPVRWSWWVRKLRKFPLRPRG
ncbi:hypothetical protein GCM10022243_03670 [Saccharothrix violaceirubra]|uniref:Polyketide cyclase/dehydrase/lipid transport protein n=1 Tax=Saccharothrix violaceirubra TaxID=413306 RepID=A0A7W7WUB4_9PSEU|nr:SRPBCC family protein [Saccharothrix violaceirubra]MBB4964115.1 hypothetical protein [Saccharothrix violaceirubra]